MCDRARPARAAARGRPGSATAPHRRRGATTPDRPGSRRGAQGLPPRSGRPSTEAQNARARNCRPRRSRSASEQWRASATVTPSKCIDTHTSSGIAAAQTSPIHREHKAADVHRRIARRPASHRTRRKRGPPPRPSAASQQAWPEPAQRHVQRDRQQAPQRDQPVGREAADRSLPPRRGKLTLTPRIAPAPTRPRTRSGGMRGPTSFASAAGRSATAKMPRDRASDHAGRARQAGMPVRRTQNGGEPCRLEHHQVRHPAARGPGRGRQRVVSMLPAKRGVMRTSRTGSDAHPPLLTVVEAEEFGHRHEKDAASAATARRHRSPCRCPPGTIAATSASRRSSIWRSHASAVR